MTHLGLVHPFSQACTDRTATAWIELLVIIPRVASQILPGILRIQRLGFVSKVEHRILICLVYPTNLAAVL